MSSNPANDANDMAEQPLKDLVLQDQAGTYYRLTPALLEQARVPDEQRAALEQQLSEEDDTTGHLVCWYCVIRFQRIAYGSHDPWDHQQSGKGMPFYD